MYSEILAESRDRKTMEDSLRCAVELCEKPDWKREKIDISIKDLEIKNQIS